MKLLEQGSTYCCAKGGDCAECLRTQTGYAAQVPMLQLWQRQCAQALELCRKLIVPSQAAKDIYSQVYPAVAQRIQVIAHGMDPFTQTYTEFRKETDNKLRLSVEHAFEKDYVISGWVYYPELDSRTSEVFVCLQDREGKFCSYRAMAVSRPDVAGSCGDDRYLYCGFQVQIPDGWFTTGEMKLQMIVRNGDREYGSKVIACKGYTQREKDRKRIAFLGGLNQAKGSDMAFRMIKHSGNLYDWYVIGGLGDPNLMTLDKKNVFKTNWYQRENVGAILRQNRIDLVCILPIWPETFCYTV